MLSIIAAIGENRELGSKNKLLWNIPGELKRFRDITLGHPIIMGRKTHESIGRILTGRENIIITRDTDYTVDGGVVIHSLEQALRMVNQVSQSHDSSPVGTGKVSEEHEIFIIGGGQIFREALSQTGRLYLTLVHKTFPDADVFFPEYEQLFTKIIERQDMQGPELSYTFLTLERNN